MRTQRSYGKWMITAALTVGAVACGGNQEVRSLSTSQWQEALNYQVPDGVGAPLPGGTLTPCGDGSEDAVCDATSEKGSMTGGGSLVTPDNIRVTHGFAVHCDATSADQHLEVNWSHGERFHLQALTHVLCLNQAAIDPGHPRSGFDTFLGEGTGTFDGKEGAVATFMFTDAGEPGRSDTAAIVIRDANDSVVLNATGTVSGNQQAHASHPAH